MKSTLVKEFKARGFRRIGGKKVELYNFHVLVGLYKRIFVNNEDIK